MRTTYLFFITALLAVSAIAYLATRPDTVSPATERLIQDAVAEAVATELQQRPPDTASISTAALETAVRETVQRVLDEERKRLAQIGAEHTKTANEALQAAQQESEWRLRKVRQATADVLIQDALRIASDVQAWKMKPRAFGGGGEGEGFTGLTFDQIGYPHEDGAFTSMNGRFQLNVQTDTVRIVARNADHKLEAIVTVVGVRPGGLSTQLRSLQPAE